MTLIGYPDTSGWEEWMNEYKFGAFYIYPPEGVIEPIDKLREKHDPKSASICQAHISLSDTLTSPITDEQIKELENALASIDPFEIHYGPLRAFPPYPGVTLAITPEDKFVKLRQAIHSTSIFKDSSLTRKNRAPHMTIAEFGLTWEETEKLMEELGSNVPQGTFLCNKIDLAIPDKNFYFQRVLSFRFGKF